MSGGATDADPPDDPGHRQDQGRAARPALPRRWTSRSRTTTATAIRLSYSIIDSATTNIGGRQLAASTTFPINFGHAEQSGRPAAREDDRARACSTATNAAQRPADRGDQPDGRPGQVPLPGAAAGLGSSRVQLRELQPDPACRRASRSAAGSGPPPVVRRRRPADGSAARKREGRPVGDGVDDVARALEHDAPVERAGEARRPPRRTSTCTVFARLRSKLRRASATVCAAHAVVRRPGRGSPGGDAAAVSSQARAGEERGARTAASCRQPAGAVEVRLGRFDVGDRAARLRGHDDVRAVAHHRRAQQVRAAG